MSRRRTGRARQYPRVARVNELVREIVADELERIDDDRLGLVAVTAVEVDTDLRHARVLFDSLDGEAVDAEVLEAFGDHRIRLQGAIGRQARLRCTPELAFHPDEAVRGGERIEAILRGIDRTEGEAEARDDNLGADPAPGPPPGT